MITVHPNDPMGLPLFKLLRYMSLTYPVQTPSMPTQCTCSRWGAGVNRGAPRTGRDKEKIRAREGCFQCRVHASHNQQSCAGARPLSGSSEGRSGRAETRVVWHRRPSGWAVAAESPLSLPSRRRPRRRPGEDRRGTGRAGSHRPPGIRIRPAAATPLPAAGLRARLARDTGPSSAR